MWWDKPRVTSQIRKDKPTLWGQLAIVQKMMVKTIIAPSLNPNSCVLLIPSSEFIQHIILNSV